MSRYYVGLDVHKASTCVAALDASGKLAMGPVVETGAATIPGFLIGLRGRARASLSRRYAAPDGRRKP